MKKCIKCNSSKLKTKQLCNKCYMKKWHKTHKNHEKKYNETYKPNIMSRRFHARKRYHKDIKKSRLYNNELRRKNITKIRERDRVRYWKNRDKKLKYQREYIKNNPEKILEQNKRTMKKFGKFFKMDSFEYKMAIMAWSKAVKMRDNYTCQICGIKDEKNNIAHHILHKAKYPLLSLNLNNGITLCKNNHKEAHLFDSWFLRYNSLT